MHTTIHLQHNFSYGFLPVIISFIAVIIPIIIFISSKKKNNNVKKEEKTNIPQNSIPAVPDIKDRYIKKALEIEKDFNTGNTDVREGYQRLSMLIREFSSEYSGVDITKKTLAEIRAMSKYQVERLLEDYYENEFSKDPKGNLQKSIEKTIEVIKIWS